jgi:hypothetical protein
MLAGLRVSGQERFDGLGARRPPPIQMLESPAEYDRPRVANIYEVARRAGVSTASCW